MKNGILGVQHNKCGVVFDNEEKLGKYAVFIGRQHTGHDYDYELFECRVCRSSFCGKKMKKRLISSKLILQIPKDFLVLVEFKPQIFR